MFLYIVRHGQTDYNGRIVQGMLTDIDLNQTGIEQAESVSAKLLDEDISMIISSPLKRAKQTAEIISRLKNIPIIYDSSIMERNFGIFEGRHYINENIDIDALFDYHKNCECEGGERLQVFFDRIYSFLDKLKTEQSDKNLLIVTHGVVSVAVECYFNGIPESTTNLRNIKIDNCDYKKYNLNPEI